MARSDSTAVPSGATPGQALDDANVDLSEGIGSQTTHQPCESKATEPSSPAQQSLLDSSTTSPTNEPIHGPANRDDMDARRYELIQYWKVFRDGVLTTDWRQWAYHVERFEAWLFFDTRGSLPYARHDLASEFSTILSSLYRSGTYCYKLSSEPDFGMSCMMGLYFDLDPGLLAEFLFKVYDEVASDAYMSHWQPRLLEGPLPIAQRDHHIEARVLVKSHDEHVIEFRQFGKDKFFLSGALPWEKLLVLCRPAWDGTPVILLKSPEDEPMENLRRQRWVEVNMNTIDPTVDGSALRATYSGDFERLWDSLILSESFGKFLRTRLDGCELDDEVLRYITWRISGTLFLRRLQSLTTAVQALDYELVSLPGGEALDLLKHHRARVAECSATIEASRALLRSVDRNQASPHLDEAALDHSAPDDTTRLQDVDMPANLSAVEQRRWLAQKAAGLQVVLNQQLQIIIATITVEDSAIGIVNNERATMLTLLAAIYLPLSLATSIFGMNIKELNGSAAGAFWPVVIAIVLLIPSFVFILAAFDGRKYLTRPMTSFVDRVHDLVRRPSPGASDMSTLGSWQRVPAPTQLRGSLDHGTMSRQMRDFIAETRSQYEQSLEGEFAR